MIEPVQSELRLNGDVRERPSVGAGGSILRLDLVAVTRPGASRGIQRRHCVSDLTPALAAGRRIPCASASFVAPCGHAVSNIVEYFCVTGESDCVEGRSVESRCLEEENEVVLAGAVGCTRRTPSLRAGCRTAGCPG